MNKTLLLLAPLALFLTTPTTLAHCDGMDGPVVKAAQQALNETNINYALVWVRPSDEAQVKAAFQKTLAVRKLNTEARDLADHYFFETLVRIHRAGEGAPYTGLKPAGYDFGNAIREGDRALQTGNLQPLSSLLVHDTEQSLRERFQHARQKKQFDPNDLAAGRDFIASYVEYIHYVEALHQLSKPGEVHAGKTKRTHHTPTKCEQRLLLGSVPNTKTSHPGPGNHTAFPCA